MDWAEEKAAALLRQYFTPLYSPDLPFEEMTPYERGMIQQLTPAVASALRELQIEKQSAEAERDYFQAQLEQAHRIENDRNLREKGLYDECVRLRAELRTELERSQNK